MFIYSPLLEVPVSDEADLPRGDKRNSWVDRAGKPREGYPAIHTINLSKHRRKPLSTGAQKQAAKYWNTRVPYNTN